MLIKIKAYDVRIAAGFALTSTKEEFERHLRGFRDVALKEYLAEQVGWLFYRPKYTPAQASAMADKAVQVIRKDGNAAINALECFVRMAQYAGDNEYVFLDEVDYELLELNLPAR